MPTEIVDAPKMNALAIPYIIGGRARPLRYGELTEIAEKSGISLSQVCRLVSGETWLSEETATKLAGTLGTTVDGAVKWVLAQRALRGDRATENESRRPAVAAGKQAVAAGMA